MIGVVLDEHEVAAGTKRTAEKPEHGRLVMDEVERVGHHDAIERGQVERLR